MEDPQSILAKLSIRNLRREDKAQVIRIDSLSTGYNRDIYFDRKFRRFFGEDAPILMGLVAEYQRRIIGFVMGEVNTGEYGISQPVASVDTIGLDPEFKRVGVGRILLDEYCSLAAKAGIEILTTLVSEDWPDVIAFFKSNGFKQVRMMALERKLETEGIFAR
ncbi:MAG: GNAT family N-acetyltransferase [Calditrichaeota bacterium]|nr:GNAT family N-acetyltransferase [Calditrichota bacterium]